MSSFEMWLAGGIISIILMLIGIVWNQLVKRHEDHVVSVKESFVDVKERFSEQDNYIGVLQSKTNDLRDDMSAVQTNIVNHVDKFKEVITTLRRMEDKIDNFRERRQ